MAADEKQLLQIEGIGEQTAKNLVEYFRIPGVQQMVEQLFQAGLSIQPLMVKKQLLTDRVFLFTGTLLTLSREEAKQLVKMRGGQVASSISHRVTDVVVGEKAGGKKKKAEELGLVILSEENFLALISQSAS